MCSVGDDNIEEESASKYLPSKPLLNLSEIKCNKCRENTPKILLRGKDAYCKECFLTATVHKFKSQLGKNKLVRHGDRVLVHHSGGYASTALLHFLRTGLDLTTPKKLKFTPLFIHVYENEVPSKIQELINEVKEFNFEIFVCSLSQYITNPKLISSLLNDCDFKTGDVRNNLILNANKTNQLDFLAIQRRLLLIDAAKYLNCNIVFTPEISSDIATQLLSNISLGRGAHLPLDIGVCDKRDPYVTIIRPLRMFELKELIFYNHFNKISTVLIERKEYEGTVQSLLNKFVGQLQTNFPSTINTIVRTGDKLATENNKIENSTYCYLCKSPLQLPKSELTSAESTSFSHWVSTQTPNYNLSPEERFNEVLETFSKSKIPGYCFSCNKLNHIIKNDL